MPEGKDMWIIFNQNSALAEFFCFFYDLFI